MRCPTCGAAELETGTRDLSYTYKGASTVISGVTGAFCPACGEVVMDGTNADIYGAAIRAFKQEVNAGAVSPEVISGIRKKLALTQEQAGAIFGGGVNAFSRYETGKTRPPVALVKLLRLLDHHPELLDEVRAG